MTELHDWDAVCAELHDGDARSRVEATEAAIRLAEERKRLGLTQRDVAELMGVATSRVSQIENADVDVEVTDVTVLSRRARTSGARNRPMVDYGNDLRQIA